MIRRLVIIMWLFSPVYILVSTPAYAGGNDGQGTTAMEESAGLPRALAKEPLFEFGTVVEGTSLVHEFTIENRGRAPLEIKRVITTCGCTTADYTRRIEPGAVGKVTIRADTGGYADKRFVKTVKVRTNDPAAQELRLNISGNVEGFAHIKPRRVLLRGKAGNTVQAKVSITPVAKYPFTIGKVYSDNLDEKAAFTLERKDAGYLLIVNNLVEAPEKYRGRIHLETDSEAQPEIIIYVYGMITEKRS